MWSCWNWIASGSTIPDFSCEVETSRSVKLVRTKSKVGDCSCVDVGLTSLFLVRTECVGGVGKGVVGTLEGPEGFLLHIFRSVEQLMHNKTNIIAKMRNHCILPPTPPKMPWNMLSIPVVDTLTACPVDSITLDVVSARLPTNFSWWSLSWPLFVFSVNCKGFVNSIWFLIKFWDLSGNISSGSLISLFSDSVNNSISS